MAVNLCVSESPTGSLDLSPLEDLWCLSTSEMSSCTETIDNGRKCTARLALLYNSPKFSDITLVVGDKRYHGHKLLLANASDVFE